MARKNSGMVVLVKEGTHEGKKGFYFYKDQTDELRQQCKAIIHLADANLLSTDERIIIKTSKLVRIGFFD